MRTADTVRGFVKTHRCASVFIGGYNCPVRILHVITRLILGGAQQNTVMSCAAQVAAGHDVHLAYGPIHGPEGSLLDEAKASGATLHEIPTLVREVSPGKDLQAQVDLFRLMDKEIAPEVIHSHSSKAGVLARWAGWQYVKPIRRLLWEMSDDTPSPIVVHTVHGLPFHERQSRLRHRLYVALERFAAKRCDHLVAIAPEMVDAFVTEKIAEREKFTVIPSGVDLARFAIDLPREQAKQQLGLDPLQPVVGLVARLDPLKGHRDLIAALTTIFQSEPCRVGPDASTKNAPKNRPDMGRLARTQVVFVGDGFDRAAVERAIADSPHRDRITMLNLVPFDDMPALYRAIDVCVLPSYQEGQSRVLVEALAAGCGIVGYDVGGIPSVCVHEKTGLLVPVGDTDQLGSAIARLLTDHDLRRRLVETGQQHIREHFSAEKMNRDLLTLYDRLVQSGR